jgi:hypothetical protein
LTACLACRRLLAMRSTKRWLIVYESVNVSSRITGSLQGSGSLKRLGKKDAAQGVR